MPYGLHWEWRGFGRLDPAVKERVTRLPLVYPQTRRVTDRYLWVPGLTTNIKLRSWPGGASLKFKRLVRDERDSGLQLWAERAEDDHLFPITAGRLATLRDELDLEPGTAASTFTVDKLLAELRAADVKVVRVEKLRRLFKWECDAGIAFVDCCELQYPIRIDTVGIEDNMGLTDVHDDRRGLEARTLVLKARERLGLPAGLRTQTYVQAVASWKEEWAE